MRQNYFCNSLYHILLELSRRKKLTFLKILILYSEVLFLCPESPPFSICTRGTFFLIDRISRNTFRAFAANTARFIWALHTCVACNEISFINNSTITFGINFDLIKFTGNLILARFVFTTRFPL